MNGLCGLIGMEFYPIRMPAPKFATKPVIVVCAGDTERLARYEGFDAFDAFDAFEALKPSQPR